MTQAATKKRPSAVQGSPVGKITGLDHLVLVCKDMDETVRFYRDLLGLRVHSTRGYDTPTAASAMKRSGARRLYFMQMPNGGVVAFVEIPDKDTRAEQSLFMPSFWPGESRPPANPRKMDHLALNVRTHDDLVWFQQHLRAHGVAVSEIEERSTADPCSIYFYDPNGVPLEIATWDPSLPHWKTLTEKDYFRDPNPVPALREKR